MSGFKSGGERVRRKGKDTPVSERVEGGINTLCAKELLNGKHSGPVPEVVLSELSRKVVPHMGRGDQTSVVTLFL